LQTGVIDLVVVPGLAFTPDGGRLGRGRGYYDQFLSRLKEERMKQSLSLFTVGVAMREQVLNDGDFPMYEHDVKLDLVLYAD